MPKRNEYRYQYVGYTIPSRAGGPAGGLPQGTYVYGPDPDMHQQPHEYVIVALHPDGAGYILLRPSTLRRMPTAS